MMSQPPQSPPPPPSQDDDSPPRDHHQDVVWHAGTASREQREQLLGQRGCVVWLTGLSGSGKSTISVQVEEALLARQRLCYRLDGDNLRHGINADLGFTPEDREENVRRVREVAALLADAGLIVLASLISPYARDRDAARSRIGKQRFVEVYCEAPLATCEARDPKGLYAKARRGEITGFTGIDAPYEPPATPDLHLATHQQSAKACATRILTELEARNLIDPQERRSETGV